MYVILTWDQLQVEKQKQTVVRGCCRVFKYEVIFIFNSI